MGTNYYLHQQKGDICTSCGKGETQEELHIGKSSIGWKFIFNPRFSSFKQWREVLEKSPDQIFDEYGQKISLFDFYSKVKSKQDGKVNSSPLDNEGYAISNFAEFS